MSLPHFTVTSTAKNAAQWAPKCIESVRAQRYPHWMHVYSAADEETALAAESVASAGVRVRRSLAPSLANLFPIWHSLPDDEIIVWLDGDDWLAHDRVFDRLVQVYQDTDAWFTYGQFEFTEPPLGFPKRGFAGLYPPGVDPRDVPWDWRLTHLRTFRAWLVKRIAEDDLKTPSGAWCYYCTDRAVMLPLADMAGEKRAFIDEVLCMYNTSAGAGWFGQSTEDERIADLAERDRIHAKPRYPRLDKMIISHTGFWSGELRPDDYGWSRELAAWIVGFLADTPLDAPIYDFGCGAGTYLRALADAGHINLCGFEGEPLPLAYRLHPAIEQRDLTVPFSVPPGTIVCLEVGEHIPAEYEHQLLDNLANNCADRLILSWAVPGQGGTGHVNCKSNDEIIRSLATRGFEHVDSWTAAARSVVPPNSSTPWFRETLLLFRRAHASTSLEVSMDPVLTSRESAIIGSTTPTIIVVDDFLANPHYWRGTALMQTYAKQGSAGVRSAERFHHAIEKELFENLLGKRITDWEEQPVNGKFQYCTSEDPIVYHADAQSYAAMIM
ncbi:MAG: hypothetical protein JO277_00650, partial [Candidatus Eremiobacteraeota bacterium]|nr:hypothetical protein [Candidatus Eremiobacteraeota bacterium]